MNVGDTIAAISSSAGRSARMILRLSGPGSTPIAGEMTLGFPDAPGAVLAAASWASRKIPCWIYRFNKPRSYTGEDLVELHIPGNPIIARELLNEMVQRGARLAEAGEFTARAFFNGRLNLTQAEGVAGVIAAQGREELEASRKLLDGELATRLKPLMDRLADLLSRIEAGIDFSDQDISFINEVELKEGIHKLLDQMTGILNGSGRFERLPRDVEMVLAGRPNAGKSTLLNALCGQERAVVSNEAGTTRDRLSAEVVLKRGKIRVVDIAGIDEEHSIGEIAEKMKTRAKEEILKADRLIGVRDIRDDRMPPSFDKPVDLWVFTHADLESRTTEGGLKVCPLTGEGMEDLKSILDDLAFGEPRGGMLTLNARHVKAMDEAMICLNKALGSNLSRQETVAFELRTALDELGKIVGNVSPDDVLGRVFSAFCVGK